MCASIYVSVFVSLPLSVFLCVCFLLSVSFCLMLSLSFCLFLSYTCVQIHILMTLIIQKCDIMTAIIKKDRDFPGGPVVKTPPSNSGHVGLISGQGTKISYASKNLVTQSCLTLCNLMDCRPPGSSAHGDSPGKNTGVGSHFLPQGIFLTRGSNPGLLHCRQSPYCLSHPRKSICLGGWPIIKERCSILCK